MSCVRSLGNDITYGLDGRRSSYDTGEAVAHIRFRHLCQFIMEPSDYYDAPIDKVLHFIRGVGLIKG
jgi:hypothetical protein